MPKKLDFSHFNGIIRAETNTNTPMKKLLLLLAVLGGSFTVFSQLAVEYRFETPVGVGTPAPYSVNGTILASASNMYFGPGLTGAQGYTAGANAGGFGCNCQPNDRGIWADSWGTNASMAVNLNDHFGVTLTALPITVVFIDSIKWMERRSGTGPQAIQLRTSADGYTGVIWSGTNFGTSYVTRSVTSGLPSFTPGTPLNIRFYGYNPTGQTGTLRVDSLKIFAHVISTLPVELLWFNGRVVGEDVELAWSTGSELNNDHFDIERSADAMSWFAIGEIEGAGNSSTVVDYEFRDDAPFPGTNYYHLRQVDLDGSYSYSHIVAMTFVEDDEYILLDASGRTVEKDPSKALDFATHPSGMYLLRSVSGKTTRKIIVVHP